MTLLSSCDDLQKKRPRYISGERAASRCKAVAEALHLMQDPKEAHARRGAPHTFDSPAYAFFTSLLKLPLPSTSASDSPDSSSSPTYPSLPMIAAPSFSHKAKDPVSLAIPIETHHKVVVFEGLYVLTRVDAWKEASERMDERVLVKVATEIARERLAKRHVESGICQTLEEGQERGAKAALASYIPVLHTEKSMFDSRHERPA